MKIIIMFSVFIMIHQTCFAQQIYVYSKSASKKELKSFLLSNGGKSLTQYFSEKEHIQDLNSIQISDQLEGLREQIKQIESLPVRLTEVDFIVGLYEKLDFKNLSKAEQIRLFSLLSLREDLKLEHSYLFDELHKESGMEEISSYSEQELDSIYSFLNATQSIVFVDGVELSKTNRKILKLPHQWLAISDSYFPILKYGWIDDFVNLINVKHEFSLDCRKQIRLWEQIPSLYVTNLNAAVDCPAKNNPSSSAHSGISQLDLSSAQSSSKNDLDQEKKYGWAVPMAIISTAVAINYFRNKQVIWHLPTLNF